MRRWTRSQGAKGRSSSKCNESDICLADSDDIARSEPPGSKFLKLHAVQFDRTDMTEIERHMVHRLESRSPYGVWTQTFWRLKGGCLYSRRGRPEAEFREL